MKWVPVARTSSVAWLSCALALGCGGRPAADVDAGIDMTFDAFVPPLDGGPPAESFPLAVDFVCAATFQGPQAPVQLELDDSGALYVLGSVGQDCDLDPGPGVLPFVTAMLGTEQSFVTRLNPDCSHAWTYVFEPGVTVRRVALGPAGSLALVGEQVTPSGTLPRPIDFDPTAGVDRRSGEEGGFVTRLGSDGSYDGTVTMVPGGRPSDALVLADGTVIVAAGGLHRVGPDAVLSWPGLTFDRIPPVGAPLALASDGSIWGAGLGPNFGWQSGRDDPAVTCRPDDRFCIPERAFVRVLPDGTHGGSFHVPAYWDGRFVGLEVDDAGDLYLAGDFITSAIGIDFDFGAPVDRHASAGTRDLFGLRTDADGNLAWVKINNSGGTSTGIGGTEAHALALDRSAGIVYRAGNYREIVATEAGVYFSGSGVVLATTLEGEPLWVANFPSFGHVAAGRDGRFAVTLMSRDDVDIHPSRIRAPDGDGDGFTVSVFVPQSCSAGDTLPVRCLDGSASVRTCAGGGFGPGECDPSIAAGFLMHRVCEHTCRELSYAGAACGTHDDGCGGTLSCGICPGPMLCAGAGRTCGGGTTATLATGLNHPSYQMALDATHVYFGTAGDYVDTALGEPFPPLTIMRVPRDGSAAPTVITTTGRNARFAVNDTHLYVADPEAGTLTRLAKDGTGVPETIATDLFEPSGPFVEGPFVYYTAARASSPIHIFELRQYDTLTGLTQVLDSMGVRMSAVLSDATYVYATGSTGVGVTGVYRWWRDGPYMPELVIQTQLAVAAIDPEGGFVYGTRPFEQTFYRQAFGTFGPSHTAIATYPDPIDMPGPGFFDGTGLWWIRWGAPSWRTWEGVVAHADVATGTSGLAVTGLNHPFAIVGDASGLFVAVAGDLGRTTDRGEIVRVW